jgi:hypothetical protein
MKFFVEYCADFAYSPVTKACLFLTKLGALVGRGFWGFRIPRGPFNTGGLDWPGRWGSL